MALRLSLLLLVLVVVCAEFLRISCFIFTKGPSNPLVVINGKNSTNVEIRWDFDLQSGTLSSMKVERFKRGNKHNTEKELANYFVITGSPVSLDSSKYLFYASGNKLGYGKLTILDITNQGTNNDGTTVNVLSSDVYVYQIEVTLAGVPTEKSQSTLEVYVQSRMTAFPDSLELLSLGGTVSLTCGASGKPTPNITWDKIGSNQTFHTGPALYFYNFKVESIGLYRCTANNGISENVTATARITYSGCLTGCTTTEVGISFDTVWDASYDNSNAIEYKSLKKKIEDECLSVYTYANKIILTCKLVRFRRGSGVVAGVQLTYYNTLSDPQAPLLSAIGDGRFAGHTVVRSFVDPTAIPLTALPSEKSTSPPTLPLTALPSEESTSPPKQPTGLKTNAAGKACHSDTIFAVCVTIIVILIAVIVTMLILYNWKGCGLKVAARTSNRNDNLITVNMERQGSTSPIRQDQPKPLQPVVNYEVPLPFTSTAADNPALRDQSPYQELSPSTRIIAPTQVNQPTSDPTYEPLHTYTDVVHIE